MEGIFILFLRGQDESEVVGKRREGEMLLESVLAQQTLRTRIAAAYSSWQVSQDGTANRNPKIMSVTVQWKRLEATNCNGVWRLPSSLIFYIYWTFLDRNKIQLLNYAKEGKSFFKATRIWYFFKKYLFVCLF